MLSYAYAGGGGLMPVEEPPSSKHPGDATVIPDWIIFQDTFETSPMDLNFRLFFYLNRNGNTPHSSDGNEGEWKQLKQQHKFGPN